MSGTSAGLDPKAVIQAHLLRSKSVRTALLHGKARPRSDRDAAKSIWMSGILASVAIGAVILGTKIAALLPSTGR
jgi:hypothetical protein